MTKQLRVDRYVHSYIKRNKQSNESFSDALARLLDVSPELDELTAYMSDDQAELFRRCVTAAEDTADVSRSVTDRGSAEVLELATATSSDPLVRFIVDEQPQETDVRIDYLSQTGQMTLLGRIKASDDGLRSSIDGQTIDDPADLVATVAEKTEQAARKWA